MVSPTKKEKSSSKKVSRGGEEKTESRLRSNRGPSIESGQRIRIRLKAFDSRIIDKSAKQIIETLEKLDIQVIGPVPLPTEISRFTVNRSTFVHKDSREQFEMRVHKRLIEISNPTSKVIDALMNLSLPAGVDIEIKM